MGTQNEIVSESIRTGVAKGYEITDVIKPKTESEVRCEKLAEQVSYIQLSLCVAFTVCSLRAIVVAIERRKFVIKGREC